MARSHPPRPRSTTRTATTVAACRPPGCLLGGHRQPTTPPVTRGAGRGHRGAGGARLLGDAAGSGPRLRARQRLRPGDHPERRRRRADQQAGADQGPADRRRGLRHRQHLRVAGTAGGRRGRPRGGRRAAPHRGAGARRGRRVGAGAGGLGRRVRQHRRPVVRRRGAGAAADCRRPDRPALRGPLRHPGRRDVVAGVRLPAVHGRDLRRGRLAGLLARPGGQRRPGQRRLDRGVRGRLHRRRLG